MEHDTTRLVDIRMFLRGVCTTINSTTIFFRTRKIPNWFNEWMRYVPVSLFTALVVKDIFITPDYVVSVVNRAPEMIAAVIVIGIAYWTRSMAISVVLGLCAVFLLALVV